MPQVKPPMGAKLNLDHPLSQGLVGCWIFNEAGGSVVSDSSPLNNSGSLTGPVFPIWANGVYGTSLNFTSSGDPSSGDLNTSIKINFSSSLNLPISYAVGLNFNSSPLAVNQYVIDFGANICGLLTAGAGNQLGVYNNGFLTSSVIIVPFKEYIAVVAITGSGNSSFYINGNPTVGSIGVNNPTSVITLGNFGGGGNPSKALIHFVMVWNRILSPLEVSYLSDFPFSMFDPEDSDFVSMIAGANDHLTKGFL